MSLYRSTHETATAAGSSTTRTFTFTKEQGMVFFTNKHTDAAHIRINSTTAATTAHGGFTVMCPAATTIELGQGILGIKEMAVIWGTDPSTSYNVVGIPVTQH